VSTDHFDQALQHGLLQMSSGTGTKPRAVIVFGLHCRKLSSVGRAGTSAVSVIAAGSPAAPTTCTGQPLDADHATVGQKVPPS